MTAHAAPAVESAVVTGATGAVGAAAVRRLRAAGVRVVVADRDPAVRSRYADDPGVIAVAGDIANSEHARVLVETCERAFGPVELLVHAAGVGLDGRIADLDPDVVARTMAVDFGGTANAVAAVLPGMHERREGRIVVVAPHPPAAPARGTAATAASLAAVHAYVRALAAEEAHRGIRVLLLAAPARTAVDPDALLDELDRAIGRGGVVVVPEPGMRGALRRGVFARA